MQISYENVMRRVVQELEALCYVAVGEVVMYNIAKSNPETGPIFQAPKGGLSQVFRNKLTGIMNDIELAEYMEENDLDSAEDVRPPVS